MRPVKDLLREVAADPTGRRLAEHAYGGLTPPQVRELTDRGMAVYTGKVRDVVSAGHDLLVVHSDRLTAFDKLIAMVPYKGTILTEISAWWLEEAKRVVPTHYLGRPQERVLRVERAEPFRVEVVVRGYLAGSMLRAYAKGERLFCGARLEEGLTPYGRLARPILTPTTKAAAYEHDENIAPEDLVRRGVVSGAEWREISHLAFRLFEHGQSVFARHGWLLVDTKYEFGRTRDGQIKVIDEIHTPDSSRLWIKETYAGRVERGEAPEMLDKETVRRWLIEQGFSGEGQVPVVPVDRLVALAEVYLRVAETLTGRQLLSAGPGQTVRL